MMDTCDILLFESNYKGLFDWWGWLISKVRRRRWTHAALVLRDPTYIDPTYKGLYVLERGTEKWNPLWRTPRTSYGSRCIFYTGVTVSPLDKILADTTYKRVAYRKLIHSREGFSEKMEAIYRTVKDTRYDTNMIELQGNDLKAPLLANGQELDRFIYRSLVGYVYSEIGLLSDTTQWFNLQPWHFSTSNNIKILNGHLESELPPSMPDAYRCTRIADPCLDTSS